MPDYFKEWIAAGVSNALTSALLNPLDVCKTRIQTSPSSKFSTCLLRKEIIGLYKEGGLIGLFTPGLTSSMIREMLNSGVRSGMYVPVREYILTATNCKDNNNLAVKILSAMSTGILGSLLANPIDVCKVRLMTNPNNSTYGMIKVIANNEGFGGFYKGLMPSTLRAASIAVGELAAYDYSKHYLKEKYCINEGLTLHIISSLITGLCAATTAAPFDVVKTLAMNNCENNTSSLKILAKLLRKDGVLALFSGWTPSYLRLAPH